MKLFEMKERPTKVGGVTLLYDRGVRAPVREEARIGLPDDPELEFYPLNQRRQFLVRRSSSNSPDRDTHVWFGGTDERPFLVRLKTEAFMDFVHKGESGFFNGLIPKEAQKLVAEQPLTMRRQGDIFAVDLAVSWEEIVRAYRLIWGESLQVRSHSTPVFETRHQASGDGTSKLSLYGQQLTFVTSGTLEAPDHRPLKLETPHALFQSEYLWDPPRAD